MDYFNSDVFTYRDDQLFCEEVPVSKIAEEYGTPVYLYSKKFFTDRYRAFDNAFKGIDNTIFFAVKSNFNLNVIKIFADLGSGIDVNSAGELHRALKVGVDPQKILLTGVGKTAEEIRLGLENNVLLIKAESLGEVYLINKIAGDMGVTAPVAIRVNPDVDPQTHPYISTGLAESKFGISSKVALDMFIECSKLPNINLNGIDMHIGSQITKVSPFVESVSRLAELVNQIRAEGISIDHFDIGGGYGIVYNQEQPFTVDELAENLMPLFKKLDCEIMFEPGRSLTANGGVLLTEVLYTKQNLGKNFIIVDAAMNDLLRPSIYGAYHHVQPALINGAQDITADIVGPVCESGDFIAKARNITKSEQGDLLAIMSGGAYGMAMASNYNARRRPPEIVVDGDNYFLTRGRESFDYLLWDEKIVEDLHK